MKEKLTKKQQKLLDFVLNNMRVVLPTYKEMRKFMGVKSDFAILKYLIVLGKKGYIERPPKRVSLYGRYGKGKFALVDEGDFARVNKHKWWLRKANRKKRQLPYVYTSKKKNGKSTGILMHRLILKAKEGELVDHINHNTLDNRRCNIRICTASQSNFNLRPKKRTAEIASRYKGVCWHTIGKKWSSYIGKHGKVKYLGLFMEEKDAAKAYNEAAKELFGEFAYLNKI